MILNRNIPAYVGNNLKKKKKSVKKHQHIPKYMFVLTYPNNTFLKHFKFTL